MAKAFLLDEASSAANIIQSQEPSNDKEFTSQGLIGQSRLKAAQIHSVVVRSNITGGVDHGWMIPSIPIQMPVVMTWQMRPDLS